MSIKVVIPPGKDNVSATGLYQWDYGMCLEITSNDIGSEIMEVHFACNNMHEAIVRPCSFSNGIGTVTIPDQCLEQTSPVTAWIYKIDGTEGHTIKTIFMPITARKRPCVEREIPQEFSNKYTELITEINEAVDNLENGNVTAKQAKSAESAKYAVSAGNASSANYAVSADSAKSAKIADSATIADVARRAQAADSATIANNANFAVEATTAAQSSQAEVLNPSKLAKKITSAGVYLVSWIDTSSAVPQAFSELIHIRDLNMFAYSNSGADNGAYYNFSTQQIEFSAMGYDTSTLVVLKIADYIEAAG